MMRILLLAAVSAAACCSPGGLVLAQSPSPSDHSVSLRPRVRPTFGGTLDTEPILRVDAPLVLIPVQVTSPLGVPVTDLTVDQFRIFEDGAEQKITSFSRDEEPLSVGLVFDASGSMDNKIHESAAAAAAFLKTAGRGDEFFLIEFGERPKLAVPFTADSDQIYTKIAHSKPFGRTSLIDALHLALAQMKNAQHSRKAIIILSDGGDNHSRFTAAEIKSTLVESDVQVYAMGLFDRDIAHKHSTEEEKGPDLLRDLAEQTGGRAYPVENPGLLASISEVIGNQLRSEYLIGYRPDNGGRDGKYRRVKIALVPPAGVPELRMFYRRGYYAPTE